jgi:hypothetical protein
MPGKINQLTASFNIAGATRTVVMLLPLVACGGRVSHPVSATNAYDDKLSCEHLRAERSVNDARVADLEKERGNAEVNSVGMLVVSPLFVDLSRSESKEIEAFEERNKVIDTLIAKRC